jgi:HEAT repeat protein
VERVQGIMAEFAERREEIWDMEPAESLAALDQIPEPSDPQALTALIALYGQVGFPQGAPRVDRYVNHPNEQVQLAAIRSVGQMGRDGSVPLIYEMVEHPSAVFRDTAVAAMGKFGAKELIPYIEAARADPEVRARAAAETRALADQDFTLMADTLLPSEDYEDLMSWISFVRPRLTEILQATDKPELPRIRAAHLLGLSRSTIQSPLMGWIAEDPKETLALREECLVGVGRCRGEDGLPVLGRMLGAEEITLRAAAVRGLAEFGDIAAFETLVAGWENLRGVEAVALKALERFPLPSGRALVSGWLAGGAELAPARWVFIDESGRLFAEYTDDLLEASLASSDAEARRDAASVVVLLGGPAGESRLSRMGRDDPDEANRNFAAAVLARWKRGR